MATFTLDIPDAVVERVFDAFCATQGYNPADEQTPAEFTRGRVVEYVKAVTAEYEANTAAETARTEARDTALADLESIE